MGTIEAFFEEIRIAEHGVHYLVIYPNMITLRRIYSYHAKMQLEDNNEIVLILPYYETTEMVRSVLSGENDKNTYLLFIDGIQALLKVVVIPPQALSIRSSHR